MSKKQFVRAEQLDNIEGVLQKVIREHNNKENTAENNVNLAVALYAVVLVAEVRRLQDELSAQSETIQKDWLSPYEAAGLRGKIEKLEGELSEARAQAQADDYLLSEAINEPCPECEKMRAKVRAAEIMRDKIQAWGAKTAGQTLPTAISDAIFEFELAISIWNEAREA